MLPRGNVGSPSRAATVEDDYDDPLYRDRTSIDQLDEGPSKLSFKRRQKASARYSLFSGPSTSPVPPPNPAQSEPTHPNFPNQPRTSLDVEPFPAPGGHADISDQVSITSDGGWTIEGPGRRIYDDLTAIDWIFEYTKERLRLRKLEQRGGLFGYFAKVLDSSQIWIVLIGTGVAAGLVAAMIDIVANWLGDLKEGYCSPSFYLSRNFCCWGLSATETCNDWVRWSQALKASQSKGGSYMVEYMLYILFSILFATSASLLVKNFAPYARHSGIPEIKTVLGGFVIRRFMGTWTLVIKSIGLCLAESSGLWLGKEGPLVHVACCCANIMMKPFSALRKNEARKREVLSAAAAAGISVAFGSPIGGVLFSLEQLSYYFPDKTMWQSFVCAMVAAVTLQFMNPFRTGKLVLYQVKYTRDWHDFEMVPFCILGILGGLYGAFFIRLNMKIAGWRKNSVAKKYPVWEVMIVAVVTALVNYPIVFMRPQSSELVANLFQECSPASEDFLGLCHGGHMTRPIVLLLLSSIFGSLLASATFGLQIPAGIILPSMAIGALYGRAMGLVVQTWQRSHPTAWIFSSCQPDIECVTPGTFAIIGAASALGGVTRMTVSIVVITFELTGALTYVLPIMVAVMISKWVGDAFGKRGIYESWIRFKEYPFLDNRDDPVPDVPVVDIMTRIEDLVVITESGHTIDTLEDILRSQPYKGFPVVSNIRDASLVGYISRSELRFALDQARHSRNLPGATECLFSSPLQTGTAAAAVAAVDMRSWMDHTPITLPQSSSLSLVTSLFQKLGLRYILFASHGVVQGLLTKKDVFFVMNSSEEDGSGRLVGRKNGEGGEDSRLLGADEGSEVDGDDNEIDVGRGNLLGSM